MSTVEKKLSQFEVITTMGSNDFAVIISNGKNALIRADNMYRGVAISATRETLGIDQVDNTSDADKPISTATAEALAEKADRVAFLVLEQNVATKAAQTDVDNIVSELTTKATASALTALEVAVGEKANVSDLDPINESINTLSTQIQSKVENEEFVLLQTQVSSNTEALVSKAHVDDLQQLNDQISSALTQKADAVHTHEISDINGLTEALAAATGEGPDLTAITAQVGELDQRVQGVETTVASKASQEDVDVLSQAIQAIAAPDLSSIETSIQNLTSTVATKADQSTVSALEGVVATKADTSSIATLVAEQTATKADQSALDTLTTVVSGKLDPAALDPINEAIALKADAAATISVLATKADQTTVDTLVGELATKLVASDLDPINAAINTKADATALTALADTVTALDTAVQAKADTTSVIAVSDAVMTKADQSAVDDLTAAVQAKSDIEHEHSIDKIIGLAQELAAASNIERVEALETSVAELQNFSGSNETLKTTLMSLFAPSIINENLIQDTTNVTLELQLKTSRFFSLYGLRFNLQIKQTAETEWTDYNSMGWTNPGDSTIESARIHSMSVFNEDIVLGQEYQIRFKLTSTHDDDYVVFSSEHVFTQPA